MNKFLKKFLVASLAVSAINFSPIIFQNNFQIFSVACAEIKTLTVKGSAGMSFGDNDEKIIKMVKNAARMNAIQSAKEKAGIFVKSFSKTVNGMITDDDISVYTSNNIKIISENYKKDFYNESDLHGNLTGNVGFKYISTVTIKIDTSDLKNYVLRTENEKSYLTEQVKNSKKNIEEINKNIEDLNKNAKNKTSEEIKSEVQKIDNKIFAEQKNFEGLEFAYQKNYQSAAEKFTESIKLNPNYDKAYYNLGNCYFYLKNYSQAIFYFNQAINLNPNYLAAYNNRGITYGISENYSQAISDFTQVLKINPNFAKAYHLRGICYQALGNYSQAEKDFAKAKELGYKD